MQSTNTFMNELATTCLKKKLLKLQFDVILARNVQNMRPVQNCTGFIFCTFHVHFVPLTIIFSY